METPSYFSSSTSQQSNHPSLMTKQTPMDVSSRSHDYESPIIVSATESSLIHQTPIRGKDKQSNTNPRDSYYDTNNPKGNFFSAYSELGNGANFNNKNLADSIYTVSGSNWREPTMNSFKNDGKIGDEKTFIRQKKFLGLNKEI